MASPGRNGLHAVNVILCASATLCLVLTVQPSIARADPLGAGSGTIYRLAPESSYQKGCFPPCLCPILLADGVRGTFKLTFTGTDAANNIHSYAVDDVNWTVPLEDLNLRVVGSGSYQIGSPDPINVVQHRMQLDLRVGDGIVEHFDSGWLPVDQLAAIHIALSMNGMVCFDTVFELAAMPVTPNQIQHYSLVEGSTYQRGCFDPCDCPLEAQRQMVGTFDLVPLSDNGTWAEFAVVNVDLSALSSSINDVIPIAGFGVYQRFAEFAVQHRLSLDLIVGDENQTHFDSGLVVTNVPFPRINIVVTVNGLVCFDTVLHVVADPSGETVCGGFAGIPCSANEFCKFPTGTCHFDDIFGVCRPIPNACPENFDPVCGCDGVTYDNECFSDAAGVSVNHPGVCEVGACCMPDGTCVELPFEVCFAEGGEPHPTGIPCDPGICPGSPTGACCLGDFAGNLTCMETTEEVCNTERGQFLGPGTVCPPDGNSVCGPTGACCFEDPVTAAVTCHETMVVICLQSGGSYQGDGTICPPPGEPPCPPSVGACCLPGGVCFEMPSHLCIEGGGEPFPSLSCNIVDCTGPTTGACCLPDPSGVLVCIETTDEACLAEGGEFLGPGIVCPPDGLCFPPEGACCFPDGLCLDLPMDICEGAGAEWLPGVACHTVVCPGDRIGACCIPDPDNPNAASCIETTAEVCLAEGGEYLGDGTNCPPDGSCWLSVGACCIPDAAGILFCIEVPVDVCHNEGGDYLGDGTTCPADPTQPCGPPFGACCFPDGSCLDLPMDICQGAGAEWLPGTSCNLVDCAPSPSGACCLGDFAGGVLCFEGTLDQCLAEGGAFQGPGSTCPTEPNESCGQVCGGFAGFQCDDPATFCKFPIGTCQFDDIFGVCTPIPNACPEIFDPVCGCDGVTYSNECEADAAMVTIAHAGECEVVCRPAPDGFGCTAGACSDIPEDLCMATLLHLDIATGAITTLACDCFDFNACHIEFGNASPFAVGFCPNDETCKVFAADTDGDGIDDQFSAHCVLAPIGACCLDIDDGPVAYDTCVSTDQDTCQAEGGIFQAVNSACGDTQACCFSAVGTEFCNDMNPFCCMISGGVAQGVGSTCSDLPSSGGCGQPCGGIGGPQCDDPDQFCMLPPGGCCCDIIGVCSTPPEACPAVFDPVCGCDGVTYGNACEAAMAAVSIDHTGSCDGNCPDVWDPVCGVDGVTYSNACFAELAGVPIAHLGECGAMCGGLGPHPPCDPGTFCKYSPGVCGDPFLPGGECTPIPSECPQVSEPVCGCDGNTYGNECQADAAAVSIDHPGDCSGGGCAATRVLSDPNLPFCSGVPKTVRILLTPPDSVTAVALDDTPPTGWIVSHISHGGTLDAINGKVKWGPFFPPDVPPEVTYDVTSAAGDVGIACFEGMISLDGVNSPVCGEDCIPGEACCPHMDADLSQPHCATCPAADCDAAAGSCADGRISLTELAGYACAWMTGCNDDLSGMTRAAFVWRNGECYCWDDADLNWHPTACPESDSACCTPSGRGSDATAGSAIAAVVWDNLKKGARSSGKGEFSWTRELEIAVTVDPPPGTSATGLAMWIPRGWNVVAMSDGGQWDEIYRKVKWGPTFGDLAQSMTLRVRWLPGGTVPVARRSARGGLAGGFVGVVSFDGVNQPVSMP